MTSWAGIDVSSEKHDCALGEKVFFQAGNNACGHEKIFGWLSSLGGPDEVGVVMEATGSYHKALERGLRELGYTVCVMNPRLTKDFAKSTGKRLKNDKVDAQMLSLCGQRGMCSPTPPRAAVQEGYRELTRQIQSLTGKLANTKKRLATPSICPQARESIEREICFYKQEILRLERQADDIAKGDPRLKKSFELALSVGGVGKKTARPVIAELALEPDQLDVKRCCSYASIVPNENSSGKKRGKATTGKCGNGRLRKALYMPAVLLAFRDPIYGAFYQRLLVKGLTHQQAIVALMHKLLRNIVAVLKRGSPWVAPLDMS